MRNALLAVAMATATTLVATNPVHAAFGPYANDANTLHLWHMDEPVSSGFAIDSASSPLGLTNIDQSAQAANSSGGTTPATADVVFGAPAAGGFGTAANFANNALIPATINTGSESTSPHRPILLGTSALANNDSDSVPFTFANATTGAFTWEANIKFDSSYDPTNTAYRIGGSTSPGNVGGGYPMEIISGEGDTNAHRNWQFRYDQIGQGSSSGPNGTTKPRIEFANLHGVSPVQSIALDLPTSGPNAVNNTDWFHVAVEYNGTPNAAGNLAFFWTDISNPANTSPVLLGTAQMTNSLLSVAANSPDFAIGDEARDAGSGAGEGESFVGSIDEVRMSDITRYAVPEPASISVLAMAGLILARRRHA